MSNTEPATPAVIGILGAGQLGRMLALAGLPLGFRFRFFDPAPESPAARLGPQTVASYDDLTSLGRFADGLDLITYEFENVPVATVRHLEKFAPIFPPVKALEVAQDRLVEKTTLQALGIATPAFAPVSARSDLDAAVAQIGLPAVLKTRRLGYDGKGQFVLRRPDDCAPAWDALKSQNQPLILEQFVAFDRELSLLAVRGRDGETQYYPLVENRHREGILRLTLAPAPNLTPALQAQAETHAARLLAELDYVGLLAIEFFQQGDRLIANEIAPRVHNSGHWTIEAAETSQFENHLRAIAGLPLGSAQSRQPAAMLNLIGDLPDSAAVLALPDAHLHLYDKAPRPNRKIGHVTQLAPYTAELTARLDALRRLIP